MKQKRITESAKNVDITPYFEKLADNFNYLKKLDEKERWGDFSYLTMCMAKKYCTYGSYLRRILQIIVDYKLVNIRPWEIEVAALTCLGNTKEGEMDRSIARWVLNYALGQNISLFAAGLLKVVDTGEDMFLSFDGKIVEDRDQLNEAVKQYHSIMANRKEDRSKYMKNSNHSHAYCLFQKLICHSVWAINAYLRVDEVRISYGRNKDGVEDEKLIAFNFYFREWWRNTLDDNRVVAVVRYFLEREDSEIPVYVQILRGVETNKSNETIELTLIDQMLFNPSEPDSKSKFLENDIMDRVYQIYIGAV